MVHFGRAGRIIKSIMRLETELKIIEMHKWKEDELFKNTEDELYRKHRMLVEWKQRQSQDA